MQRMTPAGPIAGEHCSSCDLKMQKPSDRVDGEGFDVFVSSAVVKPQLHHGPNGRSAMLKL